MRYIERPVYNRRGRYYARWRDSATGRRGWISLRTTRKRVAEERRNALELDYAMHPLKRRALGAWTFSQAAGKFEARYEDHRHDTRRTWASVLRRWLEVWGKLPLVDVTPALLDGYLRKRKSAVKATTFNKEVAYLKIFFSWARRSGHVEDDPTVALERIPTGRRKVRVLSPKEEARLLKALPVRLKPLLIYAVETGLRRRALSSLTWEMLDLKEGIVRIPGEFMKSREDYEAPLSARAVEALRGERRVVTGKVFALLPDNQWRRACKRAGLDGLKFHDLRRTFFSRARARGVSLEVAMKLSDHRDINTALKVYRAISDEELRKAVEGERKDVSGRS